MALYTEVGPAVELWFDTGYGADELAERVGKPETDEEVEDTEELDVMEALDVMLLLELEDVAVEDDEDEVDEAPQAPTIEGTASTPVPIATRLVPQFLALATCKFWLS